MSYVGPVRAAPRRSRAPLLVLAALAGAALVSALVDRASTTSDDPVASSPTRTAGTTPPDPSVGPAAPEQLPRSERRRLGEADGVVPDSVTVFDVRQPAVTKLDPALLAALRRAATDASHHGVRLYVDSGWRSRQYQEQLLRQAVEKYGSASEAARWVASPETSAHVTGDAVDLGPSAATAWLARHGAEYGLCQIYRNEPWHFELRPDAATRGCPRRYADAAHRPG